MIRDRIVSRLPRPPHRQPRRPLAAQFIQAGAAAGGGLMLSLSLPFADREAQAADAAAFAPNAFIRIESDGRIVLVMPYVEMGQGTYTAIPMLIAEELEVGLDQVRLEHAPPNPKLYGNPLSAACRRPAARPRSARRGNRCAKRAPSREPCSSRRRRSAGTLIPTPAARNTARRFTPTPGDAPAMANSPPRPPACLFPKTSRSRSRRISPSSARRPSVWIRRRRSTGRRSSASTFARRG